MPNENNTLPPIPTETPEKWEKLRKHLAGGEWPKCESDLEAMGLSKKLVPLLSTAITEERELDAIVKAADGLEEKQKTLTGQFHTLQDFQPGSIPEIEKISAKKSELSNELQGIEIKLTAAITAVSKLRFLNIWLAPLFNKPEIDLKHTGALSGDIPPNKTDAEARKLNIDVYKLASWRDYGKPQSEQRRRYTTSAPSNPLFQKGNS